VLPPEAAPRWAAPLGFLCEQRGERLGIAAIERLCSGAKLIDHNRSMAQVDKSSVSVCGLLKVEAASQTAALAWASVRE
jgi:hypothetical protein